MKIKKILVYLIFAFVMILPFNVNALGYKNIADTSSGNITSLINVVEREINSSDYKYLIVRTELDPSYYYVFYALDLQFYNSNYGSVTNLISQRGLYSFKVSRNDFSVVKDVAEISSCGINISGNCYSSLSHPYKYLNPYSYTLDGKTYFFEKHSSTNHYLDYFADLEQSGIDIKNNSDIPDNFTLNYIYVYSNSFLSVPTTSYFSSIGINSVSFPMQVYGEVNNKDEQTTILNYNGDSNSSFELVYQISDTAYKDSCYKLLGFSWACDTWVTDFMNIDIISNKDFVFHIYVSNDNKNWTYINNGDSGSTLSSPYKRDYEYLSRISGNTTLYVKYVFSLDSDQTMLIKSTYSKQYIKLTYTPISYSSSLYTTYDITGKYAIGLIPKNPLAFTNGTFKYLGDFTTYAGSDSSDVVYSYATLASTSLSSYGISYGSLLQTQYPVFYIINNNYSNDTTSTIQYLSSLYYIIEFENGFDSVLDPNTEKTYHAPSLNVSFSNDVDSNSSNSVSGVDFSLTGLFGKLPDLISGLGNAFSAIGQCIGIAFSSLPEVVQAVLYLSLAITVILVAIKLIK